MPVIDDLRGNKHLRVNLIDPDKLVKVNDLKEVTNPVFFIRNSMPTPDGLLSNEIFGITKYERANTFAYIDLYEEFLSPLIYKVWCKIDSSIKPCIHGIHNYIMNDNGELEENEDGENGIKFLKKNISKYKFRRTESNKRDLNVDFVQQYMGKPEMFISKYIVMPAYYRDINTDKGRVTIDQVNELYRSLLISTKALRESADYGLSLSSATRGRIQETLVQTYDWFGSGTTIGQDVASGQIPGKVGALRRSVMSKTTDYASRLVISAPQLKGETIDDIEADLDYSVLPLSSALNNFYPYIIFHVRRIFENEFSADSVFPVYLTNHKQIVYCHPKDYQIEFSDERIRKEINRFLTGYSNRLMPIEVPTVEGYKAFMTFKGYNLTPEEYEKTENKSPLMERNMTWCDLFYRAAIESTKDKHIMITRYPIDSYFNQFPTKIKISSTVETEPMIIGSTYYKKYPKIRQSDIGKDTSNMFIDTLNISNLYLEGIGGDYDGDQVSCKGIYSTEANDELEGIINSKKNLVGLDGKGVRTSDKEAIQSLYNLTRTLDADVAKITKPVF